MSKKKQISGMLYGLVAGLAFAIFAWGLDGFMLARANAAYPWVKFIPGLLICIGAGSLIGWLTIRLQNSLLGIVFWLALALLYAQLIIWLPLRIAPFFINIFNGALGGYLQYPIYKGLSQNLWFGFAIIAVIALICGLLENVLIEQSLFSEGDFAILVPLVICFLCFSLGGNSSDSLLNRNFREPLQEVNNILQFASAHIDQEVSPDVARQRRLGSVTPLKQYLNREYTLVLSNFDESLGQIDILVDFNGYWAKCTSIYNQVTNCKLVFETPWYRQPLIVKSNPHTYSLVFESE